MKVGDSTEHVDQKLIHCISICIYDISFRFVIIFNFMCLLAILTDFQRLTVNT